MELVQKLKSIADDLGIVFFSTAFDKTAVDFCDRARREFYLRPRYILRKGLQTLLSFSELKRNLKGSRSLVRFLPKREGK